MLDISKLEEFKNVSLDYSFDYLTNVLTKETLIDYIRKLIEKKKIFSIFFYDIDDFKYINDTYGHPFGDVILKRLSEEMSDELNDLGVIGRYGGDEFIVVVEGISTYDEVHSTANKICCRARLLGKKLFEESGVSISITTGATSYPEFGSTFEELLDNADKALYRGKKKGRNCFIVYKPELHDSIRESNDARINTLKLLDFVYSEFIKSTNVFETLKFVSKFIAEYFLIDSISYQNKDEVIILHQLKTNLNLHVVDTKLYFSDSKHSKYVVVNSIHLIKNQELFEDVRAQGSNSFLYCKIMNEQDCIGVLRVDSKRERVWTVEEREILITLAYLYSVIIKYKK